MRVATTWFPAIVVALVSTIATADDLTGAQRFLCTSSEAIACPADDLCERGSLANWGMPQFIEVDIAQKRLTTTKASGLNRTSPIANLLRDGGRIVLQGYENGRAFTFLIDEKSGYATVAVVRDDLVMTVFAACTPKAGE